MGDVIFEHRLYLPLAGYSMFLVSSVYYLFGKNSLKMMVIALTMIISCNSVLTYLRNKIWKDEFTLWSDTVRKSPHKVRPLQSRCFYAVRGNLTQAMFDFNKAIEINPDDTNAYTDRGVIYAEQGDLTQAISDFNKAIAINPKNEKAYCNRGIAYYQQGNPPQALLDYNKAIEINPNYSEAYDNRARMRSQYIIDTKINF